jgi:murein L,D-transpeptidase YcbB/YkuD
MNRNRSQSNNPSLAGLVLVIIVFFACNSNTKNSDTIVETPAEMQQKAADLIKEYLAKASADSGRSIDSSFLLHQPRLSHSVYEKQSYVPIWSKEEKWLPQGDSMFFFIKDSKLFGLFPEDYHFEQLKNIRERISADSLSKGDRRDALLWSKADIMLTDAFFQVVKDIKLGRLPNDSVTLRKDTLLTDDFYQQQLQLLQQIGTMSEIAKKLEPSHLGYHRLKNSIPHFLSSAENKQYTLVPYPEKDAVKFQRALQKRLYEGGYIAFDSVAADSAQLAQAVKKFQQEKGITVDGRAGEGTVRMLNVNDKEKFVRIAISLDKYKQLPGQMPENYIWVNAAANNLELVVGGKVELSSKVITGKPKTRTPMLTSAINSLITYPQWVPPPSIVSKEILPAVKKNPGYLQKKGFSLLDKDGNEVDPYTVDWTKYSKGVPYRIVQGSGDANALGIMKFVFDNKYSVYLHDTNQRYLFANAMRSLSHGCVRVQQWQDLAFWILRNDSGNPAGASSRIDSVKTWLQNKQKRNIPLRNKVPVFIRYITCEGKDGRVVFYDDVYGDDKRLREKYFAAK